MGGAGGNMAEVNQEAVARFKALRQRQLEESPYLAMYCEKFQAMKDAKTVRDKAVKAELSTHHQSMS
jgi:hypothetical protein